jgi:hypothetical protein
VFPFIKDMKRLLEKNIIVEFLKRNKDKEKLEIGVYLPVGRSGYYRFRANRTPFLRYRFGTVSPPFISLAQS